MKKTIGELGWPVFIMTILSLGCLIYNFIFYERLKAPDPGIWGL
jgi:hypothetical protein